MVSDYRQRTTVHNKTAVGTNGLHAANVHLASSPSISGSLHKQPIELIFKMLSPPLFSFYHRPCSCNKLHTTSIEANQSLSSIFQNPPAYRHSTRSTVSFYRKRETSTRKAENSPAERKLGSFRKFQAQNEGKDRYPYPIGYQALRNYAGHIYEMEIQEGAKGPVFVIVSEKGISCHGETPTIAWKNNPEEK